MIMIMMVIRVTLTDNKTVLQALAFINDAIKFVQTNKEKLTMSTKEEDKESKKPDYKEDEDGDQLEEKQEEEIGETTNQVF
jgi:hypothetical protein